VLAARLGAGWLRHPLVSAGACLLAYVLALLAMERGAVIAEVREVIRGTRGKTPSPSGGATGGEVAESLERAA
jgi:hypothetical protein